MAQVTSRVENIPVKILGSFYQRSAIVAAISLVPASLVFVATVKWLPAPFPLLTFLALPAIGFYVSERFYKGEYVTQGKERFLAFWGPKESRRDLSTDGRVRRALVGDKLLDGYGCVTLAFRIRTAGLSSQEVRIQFDALLKALVFDGVSIQFVKIHKPVGPDSLAMRLRPGICQSIRMMESEYFIALRFPAGTTTRGGDSLEMVFPEKILTSFPSSDALSVEEISRFNEWCLSPESIKGVGPVPQPSDTHVFRNGAAEVGPEDCVAQSVSLVGLPEEIDAGFSALFDTLGDTRSIVHVQFLGQSKGLVNTLKESVTARRATHAADAEATVRKRDYVRKMFESFGKADIIFEMFVNVVVWEERGKGAEKLRAFIGDAQRLTILKKVEGGQIVRDPSGVVNYRRDHAFIEKSLVSVLLGSGDRISTRAFLVSTAVEASYYPPVPAQAFVGRYEPTLFFPTKDYSPYYFSHIESGTHPGMAIVAEAGSGKSALLSLFIKASIEGQSERGPIAMAITDVGGSYAQYMKDHATFCLLFSMARPMSAHPLRLFTAFPNFLASALDFVAGLLTNGGQPVRGSTVSMSLSPVQMEELKLCVEEFYDMAKNHSLEELHEVLHARLTDAKWKEHLALFREFLPGGLFGTTFCPNLTSNDKEAPDLRIFYTDVERMDSADEFSSRWTHTVFSLIYKLCNLHALTYQAKDGVKGREMNNFHIVEEYFYQKRFLPPERLTQALSQIRKAGAVLAVVSQRIDDFLSPGINAKELQESFARWWILDGRSSTRALKIALGTDPEAGESESLLENQAQIRSLRELIANMTAAQARGEHWGIYIDENKNPALLRLVIERDFLWQITTNPGGIRLRNRAMELRPDLSLKEVCNALASRGPWPIPKRLPSPEFVDAWTLYAMGAGERPSQEKDITP